MASFFDPFPKIQYDMNKNGKPQLVTNILKRFKLYEYVRQNAFIYFSYTIKDGEFPDIVAHKAYGRSDLDWVIMFTNLILDPYYQWPLSYDQFSQFLTLKYGSFEQSTQVVHHYEWIIQEETLLIDGTVIPRRTLQVDHDTFLTLTEEERLTIMNYDYELSLNEKRREIKILDDQYIPQIEKEAERIFNG